MGGNKCKWYIAFVAIGIIITTANMAMYAQIGVGAHHGTRLARRHHHAATANPAPTVEDTFAHDTQAPQQQKHQKQQPEKKNAAHPKPPPLQPHTAHQKDHHLPKGSTQKPHGSDPTDAPRHGHPAAPTQPPHQPHHHHEQQATDDPHRHKRQHSRLDSANAMRSGIGSESGNRTKLPKAAIGVAGHPDGDDKASAKQHHHDDHPLVKADSGASLASTKKPSKKKNGGGGKRRYVASEHARAFSQLAYDDAVAKYHTLLQEATDEEIEQSSNKFRDIEEHPDAGVQLPTSPQLMSERYHVVGGGVDNSEEGGDGDNVTDDSGAAFCDPYTADFTPESDAACLRYLSNPKYMLSIKPMSSILSAGRTIKFKVYYKHHNVTAVLKVSQKKFALEPASEVLAMKIDRWLGLQRVPPVVWAPFPVDFLRAACATMDAFYSQWFEKFVLKYDTSRHLMSSCFMPDAPKDWKSADERHQCLNVSLQLWISDVRNAEDTILRPSESFKKYLELPTPTHDAVVVERLQPRIAGKVNPKYLGLSELMKEFVFDLVIGNTDRWFGHNSFALGGCVAPAPCAATVEEDTAKGKLPSRSSMRLAFIDQGSSFYRKGVPEMNPFSKNYENLCRFPVDLANRVLELIPEGASDDDGGKVIHDALRPTLPAGIFSVHNVGLFRAAGGRLALIARHMRQCLQRHNRSDVLYFAST